MPSRYAAALIALCLAVVLSGAESPDLSPVRQISNADTIAAARSFAESKGLEVQTYGDGPFRIMTIGGTPPKPEQLVADGELVIGGLDIWTGKQGLFVPDAQADEQVLWYLLLKGDKTFDAFLSYGRKAGVLPKSKGEDLAKQTNNTWGSRVAITEIDKISGGGLHRNITVYLATGLALRTFIAERAPDDQTELPKWLVAGMQSELERLICKSNRCYTISYEKSTVDLSREKWAPALAKLITKQSTSLLSAGDVMAIELISSPAEDYLQLWSLSAFIRQATGPGPGRRGKPGFGTLLDTIARGTPSYEAIYAQLKTDNRGLTKKWHAWAAKQR
ncbi:MAG: hypothetical protein PF961_14005 [Planctomycetota bacterium]|jgi:hypothetical protein|nr:hypothetical protein [Planctomycetota bacterium]